MAAPVPILPPAIPSAESMYIDSGVAGFTLSAFSAHLAHQLGAQMTQVAFQPFAKQELPVGAGNTSLRYRHRTGQNCRAVVAAMVMSGYTTAAGPGSVKMNGAETTDTLDVFQPDTITTWADANELLAWVKPVAAGSLVEHLFELTDARPHTLVIYEAPQTILRGAQYHVDASIGDVSRYITDDAVASNPRGFKRLLSLVQDARREQRRHLINCAWPYTAVPAGGIAVENGYLFGSAAAGDGLRIRPRGVIGAGATEMPAKLSFYVADRGASTFTITVTDGAAGSPYTLAGIAATGWTAEMDISALFNLDTVKMQITRTAGVGGEKLRIVSTCCYENAP